MATTEQVKDNVELENGGEKQESAKPKKKSETTFLGILALVVFLILLLSIPIIFTRFNILGAGEMLRPILKTNSAFRYFLPPTKDPNDISTMNRDQLMNIINESKTKITTLETQLNESQRVAEIYTGLPDGFAKFAQDRSQVQAQTDLINQQRAQLERDKVKFFEQVKNADTSSFREYYEAMSPDIAKQIYSEIIQAQKVTDEIKAFVDYYAKMDPAAAAKIFENIAQKDINLVANILKNMESGKASKILASMDSNIAGRVTAVMSKQTPLN